MGWLESSGLEASPTRWAPRDAGQDAEGRRNSKMLSKHALKRSERVSLWYIPLIHRAKTEQHWKLKELSRWIFWANESLAIFVYLSCSQSWVTGVVKMLFWEDLKSAVCWYQTVLQINADFAKSLQKKSEKDKENYQFHLFLVNFLFRFFFDLKQLLILEGSFLLI